MEYIWLIGWLFSVGVYADEECVSKGKDQELWKILALVIIWPLYLGYWLSGIARGNSHD